MADILKSKIFQTVVAGIALALVTALGTAYWALPKSVIVMEANAAASTERIVKLESSITKISEKTGAFATRAELEAMTTTIRADIRAGFSDLKVDVKGVSDRVDRHIEATK